MWIKLCYAMVAVIAFAGIAVADCPGGNCSLLNRAKAKIAVQSAPNAPAARTVAATTYQSDHSVVATGTPSATKTVRAGRLRLIRR